MPSSKADPQQPERDAAEESPVLAGDPLQQDTRHQGLEASAGTSSSASWTEPTGPRRATSSRPPGISSTPRPALAFGTRLPAVVGAIRPANEKNANPIRTI